jgi:hypothetical protein
LCAAEIQRTDSKADFFDTERIVSLCVTVGSDVTLGGLKMVVRPFVTRLSVVTAYLAFALVGAIVLGVF